MNKRQSVKTLNGKRKLQNEKKNGANSTTNASKKQMKDKNHTLA